MPSPSFDRIAGLCALLAGLGSLVYALTFLVLRNSGLSALVLLLVGLLSATALVAVYLRRQADYGSGRPPVTPITSPVM